MDIKLAWLDALAKVDPEFHKLVAATIGKGMGKGALDPKTKALIALGIDAAKAHRQGVANMAKLARAMGATNEEIKETIRVAYLAGGLPAIVHGLVAFSGGVTATEES